MVGLSRPYPFKFFKGCLRQNLLSPFLNTLSQMKWTLLTVLPLEGFYLHKLRKKAVACRGQFAWLIFSV